MSCSWQLDPVAMLGAQLEEHGALLACGPLLKSEDKKTSSWVSLTPHDLVLVHGVTR